MSKRLLYGCDTETTGLNPWKGDRPFMFTMCGEDEVTECIEFPVCERTRRVKYWTKPQAMKRLRKFYGDPKITKAFHNLKFDLTMIRAAGIEVRGNLHCSLIAMRLAAKLHSYELKSICHKYFDIPADDEVELRKAVNALRIRAARLKWKINKHVDPIDGDDEEEEKKKKKEGGQADYWLIRRAVEIMVEGTRLRPAATPKEVAAAERRGVAMLPLARRYGSLDAHRALLTWLLAEELMQEVGVRHVYDQEVHELLPIVMAMEARGVWLDRQKVLAGRAEAIEVREQNDALIAQYGGPNFNPNSYLQKVAYFIDKLKLEPLRLTKAGNPQINKVFLEHYEHEAPLARAIIERERAAKAKSSYFDNYLRFMDEESCINPTYDQVGAKTGRFSCRNPGLQQVPKRGTCPHCKAELKIDVLREFRVQCRECGKWSSLGTMLLVRLPFGPRPGHAWYALDYKQIEARIFAEEAGEETMLEAFAAGRDPYEELASEVKRLAEVDVGRQRAKNIFLGKIYGLGLKKMQYQIMEKSGGDVSLDAAGGVIDAFNEVFGEANAFMSQTIREVRKTGLVRNRYGQVIHVPRDEAYKGINYWIQSTAARLMKRAMVRCHRYLQKVGYGWLVMTIHDELIFELPLNRPHRHVVRRLKAIMEDNEGMFKRVKTEVDVERVRGTWLIKEPYEVVRIA